MGKIKVSTNYFIKQLVKTLTECEKDLMDVDKSLYDNDKLHDEWVKVRKTHLSIDELLRALNA